MFKEILQIIPKLAPNDLNNMERSLTKRFGNVAKKFGKGLGASLLGGGLAGAALGILDKILNPLKETQDAIDRLLKQGDDVATNAKQFGTTAGKLFRLQKIGEASGLDAGSLDMLIQKFAGAVAEAKADPKKVTAVRNFTSNKDIAESFFEFIQSLKKLAPDKQTLVQQEVFGEKQILKMADFLQSAGDIAGKLGGPTSDQLTPALEKTAKLNDLKDLLKARLDLQDTLRKAKLVNEGMVKEQAASEARAAEAENKKIASYDALAAISKTSDTLVNTVSGMALSLTSMVTKFTDLSKNLDKLMQSRWIRGIIGGK